MVFIDKMHFSYKKIDNGKLHSRKVKKMSCRFGLSTPTLNKSVLMVIHYETMFMVVYLSVLLNNSTMDFHYIGNCSPY